MREGTIKEIQDILEKKATEVKDSQGQQNSFVGGDIDTKLETIKAY